MHCILFDSRRRSKLDAMEDGIPGHNKYQKGPRILSRNVTFEEKRLVNRCYCPDGNPEADKNASSPPVQNSEKLPQKAEQKQEEVPVLCKYRLCLMGQIFSWDIWVPGN